MSIPSDLLVLCPSRGRPSSAYDVLYTFEETSMSPLSKLMFIVDNDDETAPDYPKEFTMRVSPKESGMGPALNAGLMSLPESVWPDVLGFVGDDHRFRTKGWDLHVLQQLESPGIAYAYDGVRADLPTQWFVSRQIVQALGWLSLPQCTHFYLDDAWRELGKETGLLRYMPEVTIEHLHYSYGKSPMDATYERNIGNWNGGKDQAAYEKWRNGVDFGYDVKTILGAIHSE